jgi:hypothetical protein
VGVKLERGARRLVATAGIIGIAVLLGAVLVGQDVADWIVGLVVGLTSVARRRRGRRCEVPEYRHGDSNPGFRRERAAS